MKYILHIIAIAVLAYGWNHHIQNKKIAADAKALAAEVNDNDLTSDDIPALLKEAKGTRKAVLEKLSEKIKGKQTDAEETIAAADELSADIDGGSTFMGILLTFLSAGYGGIVFVAHILPMMAQRATHSIYDSGEIVEKDPMAEARNKSAQGDYEGAITAYREAAEKNPGNRMPWVEIVKIQRESLHQPQAAIDTIREALEHHAWQENDAAYFLFRLAELYDLDNNDRLSAVAIMNQVIEQFPETRHSANARHKLQEWGVV